jgi:hypothetical protein
VADPKWSKRIYVALCVNAGLLALIAVALFSRNDGPALLPQAIAQQMPLAGGAGVFIVPAQFSQNTWGCYLMDVDRQTLAAYQFYSGDRQLRLVSARHFRYDRDLRRFNTAPDPEEVKELIENERNKQRVTEQNDNPVEPETSAKPQE